MIILRLKSGLKYKEKIDSSKIYKSTIDNNSKRVNKNWGKLIILTVTVAPHY